MPSTRRLPAPPPPRRGPRPVPAGPAGPAGPTRPVTPRPSAGPGKPPEAPPSAEGVRVSKLMTERGLASRREADEWIEAGWVRVNGAMAVLGQRAAPDARIEIDPRARQEQMQRLTVLLHKPVGYVSGQAEDGYQPAAALVTRENRWNEDRAPLPPRPSALRGLAPAGRLDIDSTGLLVLTQDGRIARLLVGEDSRVEKEYLVRVRHRRPGPLPAEELERLRHGLVLDGVALKPARVSWANEDQLRFVLREGRKRQIRRMCDLVGLDVVGLKRVRIGSVVLGALPPGRWRLLGAHERFI